MAKKKFKIILRFNESFGELGDWGLGKGVIGVSEAEIPEENLDDPMATYALIRTGEKHLRQLVDIIIEDNDD